MPVLPKAGLGLAILAAVAGIATVPVERSYERKAVNIQRVERDASADLFGDVGTLIGSPQKLIIEDPKAFLEGKSPEGARYVSESYLREHKIYPLQLKTVSITASLVRTGAFWVFLAGVLSYAWFERKRRNAVVGANQPIASENEAD